MSNRDDIRGRLGIVAGLLLAATLAVAAWADRSYGWTAPAFRALAMLFFEKSALADLRAPTQLALFRFHGVILAAIVAAILLASPRLTRHGRLWACAFAVGYALRAAIWIAGGNLPLVPGDSCHYVEIASSILDGEGPVKHYVESFFTFYPDIAQGRGVLDDWATPLYAYLLAGAYRLAGVVPGDSLEATFAIDKGLCFALNLVTLPVVYMFANRRFGARVGLGAMAALAVLPVHVLYAGFELRESLVALTSVLAVGFLAETWAAEGPSMWGWAVLAGVSTGLAILSRNTAMALAAAAGLYGLAAFGRRRLGPMLLWGIVTVAVITPWAWATWIKFGEPFYTYTKFFQYNFSWAVHHYDQGNTTAAQFYTAANAPTIVRVKIKSLLLISLYSGMILGLPLTLGYARRLFVKGEISEGRHVDRAVLAIASAFAIGTLANVADVTQVAQLGRYYLPLFVLMLPSAVAGVGGWMAERTGPRARGPILLAIVAGLWASPSWAYDYRWLTDPYQLHWPELRASGDWVHSHPEEVPPDARILTWFPWEFRLASRRITVLMNRSLYPPHIRQTMARYGTTHVLWGSFDQPLGDDVEVAGFALTRIREALNLSPARLLYATPKANPPAPYPVSLYRQGAGP